LPNELCDSQSTISTPTKGAEYHSDCSPSHSTPTHTEDYRYALERDKKPDKKRRPSLREGLLSRGALPSGLGSLTISTANSVTNSSEYGSGLASGRDDYGRCFFSVCALGVTGDFGAFLVAERRA